MGGFGVTLAYHDVLAYLFIACGTLGNCFSLSDLNVLIRRRGITICYFAGLFYMDVFLFTDLSDKYILNFCYMSGSGLSIGTQK